MKIKTLIHLSALLALFLVGGCQQEPPQSPTLSGLIHLDASLAQEASPQHTLYIIARKSAGPPLAVKRLSNPSFPTSYTLGPEDAMFPGAVFQGEVFLKVRLDKDGDAGPLQPGDMTGQRADATTIGSRGVDVTIDTLVR